MRTSPAGDRPEDRARGPALLAAFLGTCLLAFVAAWPATAGRHAIPASLSAEDFHALSTSLSEPNGYFRSDNLVSNEHTFQYVIPALRKAAPSRGVYLGVAPDQNFTYIAVMRPRMAFIVDIRRGNLLQHLMYKALFALSATRAEFVSRLFSKPHPPGLAADVPVDRMFSAFARTPSNELLFRDNLDQVRAYLTGTLGFPLSATDLDQLERIYFAFYWDGPNLRYSSTPSGFGRRGFTRTSFPTFEELALQSDWDGQRHSYLASEDRFRLVKDLQERNLVVPVVGNFAGPTALRGVGAWVRERGAAVSVFYVSNVEQYLFQDGVFEAFAENVATLPLSPGATFIRSVSDRFGYQGRQLWGDGRASALDPIGEFLEAYRAGRLRSYYDVNRRSN